MAWVSSTDVALVVATQTRTAIIVTGGPGSADVTTVAPIGG